PPVNIAEIVENRGSFSGEEFTICDPKRNKPSAAARPAKRMAKQPGTAHLLRAPPAVWFTPCHMKIVWPIRGLLFSPLSRG
ncbi:hypothetical protein, partial [Escherichia coli]|uniref:hypothetical protein n=1 Tax=Escherichia coli TaxID=562 RepID=UPI0032E920B5